MYVDSLGVFDLSKHNAVGGVLATYADLDAALNALNALDSKYKYGGMSFKFVHTYDNNYVRCNLLADSFTTDVTKWAIAEEGVYVDNPEFVYVKTDAEGKILWAIKKDGGIYYGAGVPQQVIDYIEEKIAELSLDEYEDIVAFLNDLEKGDKTLQDLLNEKVDKEEGKSLIDAEYANGVRYIENPEFIEAKVDAEDKVLEGIQKDGTKVIGGDLRVLGNMEVSGVSYKVVENPEYLAAWIDAEDKIIFGFKTDGKTYVGDADFLDDIESIKAFLANFNDKNIDWDTLTSFNAIENPEFIEVELDAEDKVLGGRKTDGTKVENNDVELNGNATVGGSLEVDGVVIKNIEDPEGRLEIATDSVNKVISYRKEDGTKVENVGIETPNVTAENISAKEVNIEGGEAALEKATLNSLELTNEGMAEFQQALKDSGFKPGGGSDWSDREVIELPEPKHYSLLNIDIDYLPTISGDVREAAIQYYDGLGNYFKMDAEIEIQGQTSKTFATTGGKGNYTLDLPKDIKFGSWVPQDSFHLKGCAKDVTRGILPISYKWAYMMQKHLNAQANRVLMDEDAITLTKATGNRMTDWPSDARCLPDGFPCEVYVNGEYWGLYSWQLKKHRKNYSMDKKDYTSLFLDTEEYMTTLYNGFWTGDIWWNTFDIKGPKDLICMDGSSFDGDAPIELISEYEDSYDTETWERTNRCTTVEPVSGLWDASTSYATDDIVWFPYVLSGMWVEYKAKIANINKPCMTLTLNPLYDSSNKKHKGSATSKAIIQSFPIKYQEVKNLIDAESIDEAKAKFNEYFDYNACMLVYIFNCMMKNGDSIRKNTLWGTYSNGKIAPMLWDLDGMYGTGWVGDRAVSPNASLFDGNYAVAEWPLSLLWQLYENEIKASYASLRSSKILTIETWKDIVFNKWVNRIGEDAYNRDIKKWPDTPSYREDYTNTEYWSGGDVIASRSGQLDIWNEYTEYNVGSIAYIHEHPSSIWYKKFTAKKASGSSNPQCPVTKFYERFPQVGGFYDSPKRWVKWMTEQIRLCDIKMGYSE
jgi:hypothetical protein